MAGERESDALAVPDGVDAGGDVQPGGDGRGGEHVPVPDPEHQVDGTGGGSLLSEQTGGGPGRPGQELAAGEG